jgi:hypothetical protein
MSLPHTPDKTQQPTNEVWIDRAEIADPRAREWRNFRYKPVIEKVAFGFDLRNIPD